MWLRTWASKVTEGQKSDGVVALTIYDCPPPDSSNISPTSTVADTRLVLFFSGISNAFGIQGGANICNAF